MIPLNDLRAAWLPEITPRTFENKDARTERGLHTLSDRMHPLHAMQAEWDAENAISPMPTARPSWAGLIGGALLIVLFFTIIGGLWIVAGVTS